VTLHRIPLKDQWRVFALVNGKRLRNIVIIILLIIPLLGVGFSKPTTEYSVWIVNSDNHDVSIDTAVRTILDELASSELSIKETTLDRLESVPLHVDILVLVGHGQTEGLETPKALIPWIDLYNDISERQPQKTIVLACNSPSDQALNIIGFDGRVDAEAGAIVTGWYIQQAITQQGDTVFPFDRIAQAQKTMKYPLGRYLYFVHGYWGADSQFDQMISYMDDYSNIFALEYDDDNIRYFSYFDYYGATTDTLKNALHYSYPITSFADNLYNELRWLGSGSQVNFVAHSMGGIIVREMLRQHRADLNDDGINIGKVITIGTPNDGTELANPYNPWSWIASILSGAIAGWDLWPSPVFWSMTPDSGLITALNSNPQDYSYDIDWYTASGYWLGLSEVLYVIHDDISDPIVAQGRAHLSFATDTEYFDIGHEGLITDSITFSKISEWIMDDVDSDGDGLSDDAEIYYFHTDPNYWNSDGDGVGDWNEIDWGYDPIDNTDPIPATQLVSSVSYTSSTRYVRVYVNHFTNKDYVKFYVKYKTKYSWTSYYYMGTDYSPSSGKYYDSWTHPTGYIQMTIKVNAYDSSGRYIGCDYYTRYISDGGGGGGGDPPIE